MNTSTLAPRKVFSSPGWAGDRETITVTNSGDRPILVRAWVGDPSNNVTVPVDAGATKAISTASVLTQDNQILTVGFDAYDNGTAIDTYKATLALGATPTPTTTTRSPGPESILVLACLLGAAVYLMAKKER